MNLGLSTVHNVRMSVDAPGLIPDKTAFLGNIESGAAKKGDLYVFVGALDMTGTAQNEDKYGMTSGKTLLIYEDQYGQEYTEEFEFSANINPPVIMAPKEPEEEEEPQNQNQWWISVSIVAAIIVTIVVIRFSVKKRQKRIHEQEDTE
jgi:bisphosphoglycerate-dependent phosphoglycerate mutase